MVSMIENEYTANGRKSLRRLKGAIAHLATVFGGFKATLATSFIAPAAGR